MSHPAAVTGHPSSIEISQATRPGADLPPKLRLVFWESTAGCNLRCVHCRRIDVAEELMPNDLKTDEVFQMIDGIARAGRPIFVLSGGEPLMRPDVFDIARYATAQGLPVALATNGTLIDEEKARQIYESGIRRASISIDGGDAATHDGFRGLPGAFEAALNGARNLKKVGVSFQFNVTITRHNAHQRDAIHDLAVREGADAMHLFMLVPVGCGMQIADTNMLSAEEYEEHLRWLADRMAEGQMDIRATCAPHYFRITRQRARETGRPMPLSPAAVDKLQMEPSKAREMGMNAHTKGCLAGTGVAFVSHKGEVFPCGYFPVESGHVRQQTFDSVWADSPVFERLRDNGNLGGKCNPCEFKEVCGGCRARAYSITGDYMAEEPYCTYVPAVVKKARAALEV